MFETIARPYTLRMNLQLFAGDGGGSGGSGGSGGGEGGEGGNGGGADGEKKFTQAELDAAIQSRLSRAEKAAQKALAKELGYDSVEAMTAALKKQDGGSKGKEGDDKKTEPVDIEKLLDERLKEREKEQNEKTFKRLLTAEVKVLANELGFADWEDALKLADLSKCKENDKGEIEGVKEALEDLAKKKPHLLKQKPGGGKFGADVRNSPDEKKKTNERLIELAKNRGVVAKVENDPWARK